MQPLHIPPAESRTLEHLVLDFNGTLAQDGELLPGIRHQLGQLAQVFTVHVLTADTYGGAARQLEGLPVTLTVLAPGHPGESQAEMKARYVRELGAGRVAAVGNGHNDRMMLAEAALGLAVINVEGAAATALVAARAVFTSTGSALAALLAPKRLVATLRD